MSSTGRCAVCKYFRRRCPSDCIFSPHFPPNNPQRFSSIHRIYGASNIGKMLQTVIPGDVRGRNGRIALLRGQMPNSRPRLWLRWNNLSPPPPNSRRPKQLAKTQAEIAFLLNYCSSSNGHCSSPPPPISLLELITSSEYHHQQYNLPQQQPQLLEAVRFADHLLKACSCQNKTVTFVMTLLNSPWFNLLEIPSIN